LSPSPAQGWGASCVGVGGCAASAISGGGGCVMPAAAGVMAAASTGVFDRTAWCATYRGDRELRAEVVRDRRRG
jgi:hypothetical protein